MHSELQNHPVANLFPMMSDEELQELAQDIRENGLLEPIEIYDGMVLDGRNRLAASKIAKVEPRFHHLNGEIKSAIHYVASKNLHRRHLTVAQRAKIGVEMIPLLAEEAEKRQIAQLKHGDQKPVRSKSTEREGKAVNNAAELVGVGATTVYEAKAVKEANPSLYEQIGQPEVPTVHSAYRQIKQDDSQKSRTDVPQTPRQVQLAESQKRKMVTGLSTITGLCAGLEELDVDAIVSICDVEERRVWTERTHQLANKLRKFAGRMENSCRAQSN